MTTSHDSRSSGATDLALVFVRWLLGAYFVYAGLSKAMQPAEFLQVVRLYQMVDQPLLLNTIAALLPWLEVFFGLLLVIGVAVRGTALLLIGMLLPFTVLIVQRALALQAAEGIPFCAVRFDCGCGTGDRLVCGKIAENFVLLGVSLVLLGRPNGTWCVRYGLVR